MIYHSLFTILYKAFCIYVFVDLSLSFCMYHSLCIILCIFIYICLHIFMYLYHSLLSFCISHILDPTSAPAHPCN